MEWIGWGGTGGWGGGVAMRGWSCTDLLTQNTISCFAIWTLREFWTCSWEYANIVYDGQDMI